MYSGDYTGAATKLAIKEQEIRHCSYLNIVFELINVGFIIARFSAAP
jgi:hypothetical protein